MEDTEQKQTEFFKNKHCIWHTKKRPTFVCLDYFCENKGLICASCLTIKGNHKGHDSLELGEFLDQINDKFASAAEIDKKFQQESDIHLKQNIDSIRHFQKKLNDLIDSYVEQRVKRHQTKMNELNASQLIQKCKQADFKTLEEFNSAIKHLSTKLKYKNDSSLQSIEADSSNQTIEQQLQQVYLEDFDAHMQIIEKYLNKEILPYLEQKVFNLDNLRLPKYYFQPFYLQESNLSIEMLNNNKTNDGMSTYKGFYENQEIIYIGELQATLPHGKGLCYFRHTGKIYEGEFLQGKLHGKGRIIFQNGDTYIGDFHLDKKQGRGIYIWTQKGNYYEGEFWNSKRHGQGLFISSDGSQYEGNFKDGVQSGYGTLKKKNGEIEYEGQWSNGCFEGKGIQYLENGDKYNGEFSQDMFNGRGVYTKKIDNTEIHGIWKNNQLVVVNQTISRNQQEN
ncbi:hypothetical protein ABPG72_004111 [Tetrahymena utriculariae]